MLFKKSLFASLLVASLISTSSIFCMEDKPDQVRLQSNQFQKEQPQDPAKKVFANVAACGGGAMCGYLLKAMWEDTGKGYYGGKVWATAVLLFASGPISKEFGVNERLVEISMIAAAVLAKIYNK